MDYRETPIAIIIAEITGGICILAVIIGLVVLQIGGIPVGNGVIALFGAIVSAFLTGVFSSNAHTVGYRNGVANGKNMAEADTLKTLIQSQTKDGDNGHA